jgi:hypothetical protein
VVRKKPAVAAYVARIEAAQGGHFAVLIRDGEEVYRGPTRPSRKTARMDAALFVAQAPEQQRDLQRADPFPQEPDEEGGIPPVQVAAGPDLAWLRNWAETDPRLRDEERGIILAAMDAFERLRPEATLSGAQLQALVVATRSQRLAACSMGCRLLGKLACQHGAAQEAYREVLASGKAKVRLEAIFWLHPEMPRPLLQDVLGQRLADRSKHVRKQAARKCDLLNLREIVPALLRQAEVEADAEVKRELEYHARMIQDGYVIERDAQGGLTLSVRLKGGCVTWQEIKRKDVDRGNVPALVAKLRAHWE